MSRPSGGDLAAYLARIGYRGSPAPDLPTLRDLHVRHLGSIPFENVDVYLGRPGSLELSALWSRMVDRERGGYCFEHNTLFAAVLRSVGFRVDTLEARVRPAGATAPLPRTHMTLRVNLGGQDFLADVGFGGDGPLYPVPLDGAPAKQHHHVYRVDREDDGVHVLRHVHDGGWRDLYAFTLAPALPVDFEVAHHYTSTHPRSRFVLTLTAQRSLPDVRHILRGRSYTVRREGKDAVREIADAELGPLLEETFGLRLGDDVVARLVERLREANGAG